MPACFDPTRRVEAIFILKINKKLRPRTFPPCFLSYNYMTIVNDDNTSILRWVWPSRDPQRWAAEEAHGVCLRPLGLADGVILPLPVLVRGSMSSHILINLTCFSLLDSVMQEQVVIPMDDDVTVLNRPVETKYYSPPPQHEHPDTHRDYDF